MKTFKKILKFFVITVFSIALLAGLADAAWVFLPRLLSARKIAEVDSVAKKVEDLTVPESAKVIALGEATHGNKEFQELRLEVLKHLIQSTKVRSFALEADWGEGMTINNYIHGGKGNATDIVKDLAFSIYRTKEMADGLHTTNIGGCKSFSFRCSSSNWRNSSFNYNRRCPN